MKFIKKALKKDTKLYKYLSAINYYAIYINNRIIARKSIKLLIKHIYKKYHNEIINLETPSSFSEKLQWLKIYWYDERATMCCDKYLVRNYLEKKGFSNILNKLVGEGVYDISKKININSLPDKFVIKPTHDSGHALICTDKSKFNFKKAFSKLDRWLKVNYAYMSGEWPYKDITPRIICEEYLEDGLNHSLTDYKFFCFNGKPEFVQVDIDRFASHKRNFYDLEWNLMDMRLLYPNDKDNILREPKLLDNMIEIAERLSEGFPFVRVDLYYTQNDKIIFGELTFFPEGGTANFEPFKWNEILGKKIKLPSKKNPWNVTDFQVY